MKLEFYTFASSSGGNSYLVRSENSKILVDVGISHKKMGKHLDSLGVSFQEIDGILLTHEHSDHIKGIKTIHKKLPQIPVYATAGTFVGIVEKYDIDLGDNYRKIESGESFFLGDIRVRTFQLSHDAREAVGYTFEREGQKISIVTDTGYISEEIFENIKDSDILLLEANHEVNFLLYGGYPYHLKQRILSDYGHLSNEAAANCILRILKERKGERKPLILLAHLSKENNSPLQAYSTVSNILEENGFIIGRDLELKVAERDQLSRWMVME